MIVKTVEDAGEAERSELSRGELVNQEAACLFCGTRCVTEDGATAVELAKCSSKSNGTSLLSVITKVVGYCCMNRDDRVCGNCCQDLHQLDHLTDKSKQLQKHLLQRYRSERKTRAVRLQSISRNSISAISNTLATAHHLMSGTTIDVTSSLSVTVMHEPMPKKRRYGIPEDEYLNSGNHNRKHCCNSHSCRHYELRNKPAAPRGRAAYLTNYAANNNSMHNSTNNSLCDTSYNKHYNAINNSEDCHAEYVGRQITASKDYINNYINDLDAVATDDYNGGFTIKNRTKSIKCTVGDLDKSHISSILRTPNRSRTPRNIEEARCSSQSLAKYKKRSPNFSNNAVSTITGNGQLLSLQKQINQSTNKSLNHPELYVQQNTINNQTQVAQSGTIITSAVNNTYAQYANVQPPLTPNKSKVVTFNNNDDNIQVVNCLQESDDSSDSDISSEATPKNSNNYQQQHKQVTALNNEDCSTLSPALAAVAAAQALLLSTPAASSLLQSFLTTSLWLHGGGAGDPLQYGGTQDMDDEQADKDKDGDDSDTQVEQMSEDVTCETLAVEANVQDKNTRQELKNTGQSYVNTKGKMVDAKRVAPQDCSKCVMRCSAKLSEADRQSVFAEFWGLADYGKQREYLAEHMHREEKLGPSGLTRTVVLYYLTHNKKLQVCRQFFLKTLDVSEKASRIVLEKKLRGDFGNIGAPPPPPTHRTTSSRSRRMVANNQDSDYEY